MYTEQAAADAIVRGLDRGIRTRYKDPMLIQREEFGHPTQASRVRLNVFEQPAGGSPVEGLPDEGGFLVTEERIGTVTVVSTLGFFTAREEAVQRLRRRAAELQRQSYRALAQSAA